MKNKRSGLRAWKGFTLIELLTVIAIIGILMGLMAVLVATARARASRTKAQAEVRELVRAWKAYWVAYQEWPAAISGQNRAMDPTALSIIQGNNPQRLVFMELDPSKPFLDPWGNTYYVDFSQSRNIGREHYQTVIFLSNRVRYNYE